MPSSSDQQADLEVPLETLLGMSGQEGPVAVAVSGGSDSVAAALLTKSVADRLKIPVVALTVDHGLRAESAGEAKTVGGWMAGHGIDHHVLKWKGPYPKSGIQMAAREARYSLLQEKCEALGITRLILGHQQEDQLETMLMRLSKGSGVQGLSVMKPLSERNGLSLLRPFLDVKRARLREYLEFHSQPWLDDPSNENPAFTRTRLGDILKSVTDLPGSSQATLALSASRLRRAEQALEVMTGQALSGLAVISPFGFVSFRHDFYQQMPDEIAIRFLHRLFIFVRGSGAGPALTALEKLLDRIRRDRTFKTATLYGCQFRFFKGDWLICREPGRKGLPVMELTPLTDKHWDDRFIILDHHQETTAAPKSALTVQRIGSDGWRLIKESAIPSGVRELPAIVRKNLPAVWSGDELFSAPLFSYDSKAMGIAQGRFEMVFNPKCNLL